MGSVAQANHQAPPSGAPKPDSTPLLIRAFTRPGALILLWAITAAHVSIVAVGLFSRFSQWDFSHYYVSALALREHLNPYTADLRPLGRALGVQGIDHATYPPTFLLCFEPLTLLSPHAAYLVWFALNAVALAVVLVMLLGKSSGAPAPLGWLLAALAFWYWPLYVHFYYAQTQILLALMLLVMMRLLERGADRAAGCVLALAGLFKIFPLLMVGYLLVRRRWRAVAFTGLGVALGIAVTFALAGVDRSVAFVGATRAVTGFGFIARPADVALGSFISRLFWYAGGLHSGLALDWVRRIVVWTARLALFALTVRATMPSRLGRDPDWRGFALWITAVIMLSPTAWIHYLVLLLIPTFRTVTSWASGRASNRALAAAIVSFAVVEIGMVLIPTTQHLAAVVRIAASELFTVSLLIAYLSAYWFVVDGPGWKGELVSP